MSRSLLLPLGFDTASIYIALADLISGELKLASFDGAWTGKLLGPSYITLEPSISLTIILFWAFRDLDRQIRQVASKTIPMTRKATMRPAMKAI